MSIYSIGEGKIAEELLDLLISKKSAFIIAVFQGANRPYDFENYYNLGKCGKQYVEPQNIVAEIDLSDSKKTIIDSLEFTPEQLSATLTKEKIDAIKESCADIVWSKILKIVSEKNK